MISGQDIICFSSIDWDFNWQGHQEIMSTLAGNGNRVLFVENTGVRVPGLRDLPRLRTRLRKWLESTKGFRKERTNLFVYSPLILPFPYSKIACRINRGMMLRALKHWMRATGFRPSIVWTFLPTPIVHELIDKLNPELTVYYCIDDLASSSPYAKRITRSETKMFREADLVFVTSEKLRERAARFSNRVHLYPFGVDFEKFEKVRSASDDIPADLRALPRPVIGYVGGIHQWVDQQMLLGVAARMPHASFVLVGPPQTDISRLSQHSNIHLLSARPHAEMPQYIKGFDVGVIAYRLSEYTAHVYPTKLNEYLAMGIPVVATDLPEVRRFNAGHGDIVAVAHNTEEFAVAIRAALENSDSDAVARRIEVARCNSWSMRISKMSALIEEKLINRRGEEDRGWEISLRRIYQGARRQIIRLVLCSAAAYFLLFQSPFLWWLAEPLRVSEPARPADAIVVFAGGVGESGKAGGGYQERVKKAIDLYEDGMAPRMIFSSGYVFVFQEAEVMRELAVSQGVPVESILLETAAANTYENVLLVNKDLNREQWESILLVSSPYHMRRALLIWQKVAPDIVVIPTPVPVSQFYVRNRVPSMEQVRGILHEYFAIIVYWWRGWL